MKLTWVLLLLINVFSSCKGDVKPRVPTFDSYGNETMPCSVRDAKGHGPYVELGVFSKRVCRSKISLKCREVKYKQKHKRKGYFARGKFGDKILIGTCD